MGEKVKLRIPAIVTADGKWAANGSHQTVDDPDWQWVDEMCDFDNPTKAPQRYWIEVEVEIETREALTVTAKATAA